MSLGKYIAAAVLIITGCDSSKQEVDSAPLMSVSVVRSEERDFSKEIHLNGSVLAKELVNISTELTSKEILSVKVSPGDRVQKGQVLADLDMVKVQSQFAQNEAKLRQAELTLKANYSAMEEAKMALNRYRILSAKKAVSMQDLENKRTSFDTAWATYESTKAEIQSLKALLATSDHDRSKAQIKAPFSGIIVDKNAEEGDLTSDKPLFTMIKGEITEIDATASEDEIKYLREGMKVRIVNSNGRESEGMIRLIYPSLDGNTRLGRVKIRFCDDENAYSQFILGSYVDIYIRVTTIKQVRSLPLSAVSFERIGKATVKTVDDRGVVKKLTVRTGYSSDEYVEITSVLPESVLVIKKADALVREGDKVKPVFKTAGS